MNNQQFQQLLSALNEIRDLTMISNGFFALISAVIVALLLGNLLK